MTGRDEGEGMNMWNDFHQQITGLGVIPVAVIDDVKQAIPLANALCAGGLPAIEVTFRTDAAADAIREVASSCPDVLVGAGTVLSCGQVDAAVDAGAKFIVSPGFDVEVVRHCVELNVPMVPGTVTPSEILAARNMGITLTKFFPAGQFGGVDAINALAAPFAGHLFMPTGGINARNLVGYLSSPYVSSCGGTWLASKALLKSGRYDQISRLCREAVAIVRATRGGMQ